MFQSGLDLGQVAGPIQIPAPQVALQTNVGVFSGLGLLSTQLGVPRIIRADVDRLVRQRILGSRADIPLGIPVSAEVLQRTRAGVPKMGGPTVAQGATEILETITGQEESGVFDDIFGGIGDVFGNLLEGINSTVEGVASVVGDVASTAGQIGQVGVAFEEAIGGIRGQVSALPALIRGRPPVLTPGSRAQDVAAGVGLGELIEEGIEYVTDFFDDEEQVMEGELIPANGAMAACDLDPANYYYGYSSAANGYVLKKKRRRRRKMLATPSDLKQLAALKGVLGQGKAFETWIATRSV